jgi:hypothetical protein
LCSVASETALPTGGGYEFFGKERGEFSLTPLGAAVSSKPCRIKLASEEFRGPSRSVRNVTGRRSSATPAVEEWYRESGMRVIAGPRTKIENESGLLPALVSLTHIPNARGRFSV